MHLPLPVRLSDTCATSLNHRNNKRDENHLNKHAMHLVRLYLMAFDILEKEEIKTYRADDMELLMSLRNGSYMLEDGSYRPEFFEYIDTLEKRLAYAVKNTALPQKPDYKRIGIASEKYSTNPAAYKPHPRNKRDIADDGGQTGEHHQGHHINDKTSLRRKHQHLQRTDTALRPRGRSVHDRQEHLCAALHRASRSQAAARRVL